MRWSKLKQQVESRFAQEVRGRVGLWTTRYDKAHDHFGRSWITIDGQEIVNMSNYLRVGNGIADGNGQRFAANVFAGYDLPAAMRAFLTLPIDAALASENPLVVGLAVLDRRAGHGRLAKIEERVGSPLVRQLLALRRRNDWHPEPENV